MKMKPVEEQEEVHNKQWTQKLQMFFLFFFFLGGEAMNLMCIISLYNYWGKGFPLVYEKLYSWAMMSAHLQNVSKVTAPRQWHFIPLFLIFFSMGKLEMRAHFSRTDKTCRLACSAFRAFAFPQQPASTTPRLQLSITSWCCSPGHLLGTLKMQWAIGKRIQKVWKPWMLLLLLGNLQCNPARCVLWNCPDVACLTKACTTAGKQSARPANWCKHIHRTGLPSASWGQNVPRCLFLYQLLLTVHLNWRKIILFFFSSELKALGLICYFI